jgi:hypothetical protein
VGGHGVGHSLTQAWSGVRAKGYPEVGGGVPGFPAAWVPREGCLEGAGSIQSYWQFALGFRMQQTQG